MEKVVRIFDDFEDAARADAAYYASLTPNERIAILLQLCRTQWGEPDGASARLPECVASLISHGVEFLVAGGFAVAYHGHPRYTGDIDILIRATPDNAARLIAALQDFGFGDLGLTAADFLHPDRMVQLGRAPVRIDLLTSLSSVEATAVWAHAVPGELDGLAVNYLGLAELLATKRATGRPQDLADVAALTGETGRR